MRQLTFASQPSFEKYARKSSREEFLSTMQSVLPWAELEARMAPHYPKAGKGRQPVGLSVMLRIHFLQHWFAAASAGRGMGLAEDAGEQQIPFGNDNKKSKDCGVATADC